MARLTGCHATPTKNKTEIAAPAIQAFRLEQARCRTPLPSILRRALVVEDRAVFWVPVNAIVVDEEEGSSAAENSAKRRMLLAI